MRLEYVLDRYLAVCRLVDQSVVSLHQCACSLRGARDGAQRMLRQVARARHQTRAQARIAQRCAAELVRRPGLGVEPVAKRQRHHARCGAPPSVPATPSPVHTYTLPCASWPSHGCGPDDRAPRSHLRAPSSPPANSPRCARARQRTSPVARADSRNGRSKSVPTARHHPTQDVRSQVAARHPGADQKPAQSHHPVQLVAAPRVVPANPGIARLLAPRGGRKADATQPAVRGAHQIAQLMADPRPRRHAGARVPSACSRSSCCASLSTSTNSRSPSPPHRGRHRARRRHRLRQHPRLAQHPATAPRRWQRNLARCFQLGQRLAATRALQPPAAIAKIERFTDPIGNPPDALDAARGSAVQHLGTGGQDWPAGCPLSDSEPACRLR